MKKYIFTLLIALFAFNAYAADLKIGFIDLNRALSESTAWKHSLQSLEKMVKAKQAELDKKGDKIKKIEELLAKQASILTENSIKEKKDEHDRLFRDFQRMLKDSQEELKKKEAEFMNKIVKDIRQIVVQLGKDEGYSVIFEKAQSGLLYSSTKIDITDNVIKRVNEASKQSK